MFSCGFLLKSALVAAVLLASTHSGSADEKLASCCTTVTRRMITEPITGYMIQKASPPCVPAVIFQTEKGIFCSHISAPWVHQKIVAFRRANAKATRSSVGPSSTVSLLSIITSTASTPSSSSLPPSFTSSFPSLPPTPKIPAGETFSEGNHE